jgi:hypothetical protein
MSKLKRLIVMVVILAVIAVMALRGCPRIRRSLGVAHKSLTAGATLLPVIKVYDILLETAECNWKGI